MMLGVFIVVYLFIMETTTTTRNIVTVYCQGNGASRNQATKYAGPWGVDVSIGNNITEHVYIRDAPLILHNIYTSDELDDIGYGFTLNPLQLLSKIKSYITILYFGIHGSSVSHSHFTEFNVAGESDRNQYIKAVRQCIADETVKDKDIVLFGTSRGASTVLVSLPFFTEEERSRIKLVLVEGPFDTVDRVVRYQFGLFANLVLGTLSYFTKYKPDQLSPLDAVSSKDFPLDLPIGFIRSKVDNIVPPECTLRLIDTLKKRNHSSLHELELSKSHHSMMSVDDEHDKSCYLDFVNNLYKKFIV